jgi:hypothetical protein
LPFESNYGIIEKNMKNLMELKKGTRCIIKKCEGEVLINTGIETIDEKTGKVQRGPVIFCGECNQQYSVTRTNVQVNLEPTRTLPNNI